MPKKVVRGTRAKKKAPRLSRQTVEQIEVAERTRLEMTHQNSAVIASRMRVVQCEADELEKSEMMLRASLDRIKARRRNVGAILVGLQAVLSTR